MPEAKIVITDKTPQSEITKHAANPNATLDVTGLASLDRLGPKVAAQLYTEATHVDAQLLIEVNKITAPKARQLLAINLEKASGGIDAPQAEMVSLMRMRQNSAPLNFPAARQVDFAELRFNVGPLTINDETRIIAPKYEHKSQFSRVLHVVDSAAFSGPIRGAAARQGHGAAYAPAD